MGHPETLLHYPMLHGETASTLPTPRTGEAVDRPIEHNTDEHSDVVLGSFLLVEPLGRGSFATAYLTKQLGTDREAVVKIAHPDLARGPDGEVIRERFRIEARASTRVQHPNLIMVYTTGEVRGAPAIAMEYAPGATLLDHLERHAPLSEDVILEIFAPIADALSVLHDNDIIHRDISPNNIILKKTGERFHPKILDFGISQLDGVSKHTQGPIGTPQFMAPEILRGELSEAVDLFSLGQLLWWAIEGAPMIPGESSVIEAFEKLHALEHAPKPDGSAMARYSSTLIRCVRSLLDPDPAARPSASEVHRTLAPNRGTVLSSSGLGGTSSVPQDLIDEFLERLPRWIFDIETALLSRDRPQLFSLCGEISSRALVLREAHLTEITRALCELDMSDYQTRGVELCEQLGEECKRVFDRTLAPAPA